MHSFKNYLQERGNAKATIEHYQRVLLDFITYLDQDGTETENATAKEVLAYQNKLIQRGYQNKTRNTALSVVKKYFNYQIEIGERTENPVQHLTIRGGKKQKLYPILERHQLDQIHHNYKTLKPNDKNKNRAWFKVSKLARERNKVILSLMIHQALTTAEIDRLQAKDLKLKEGKIYIAGTRKSNERTLELKSHQMMELMNYQCKTRVELLKYCKEETGNLFISTPPLGQGYNRRTDTKEIWKLLTKEIKAENKDFINFKQVRTSIITHWLKQYNLRKVQYMAGHRYVSSTERYLINNNEDLQEDIDQFHPF